MPLTALREQADQDRRKRFASFVLIALAVVIGCTGLQVWMIGDTRSIADDARIQVEHVRDTQRDIRTTQQAGVIRGLKLRAVECRNTELLGGTFLPGDACLDAEMKPYFIPSSGP